MKYRVQGCGTTVVDGKVVYHLRVTDMDKATSRLLDFRYSQVLRINDAIEKALKALKLKIALPPLPARRLIGSTNDSDDSIKQRMQLLVEYFSSLLKEERLLALDPVEQELLPQPEAKEPVRVSPSTLGFKQRFNLRIIGYEILQDVVFYTVQMKTLQTGRVLVAKYRYSALRQIADSLESLKLGCPKFPGRQLFKVTNESKEDIERRREQIQTWFNSVLGSPELVGSAVMQYFLEQTRRQSGERERLSL